jgi:integrase
MTATELTTNDFGPIKRLVLDSVNSAHSRRAYEKALDDFLNWHVAQGCPPFRKNLVQSYKRELPDRGLAPSTINQRLSAIRRLAAEAADNGWLDANLAVGVCRVRGVPNEEWRSGNWLTKDQAQALLSAPDVSTLKGLRDRAILAVLLGAGLRRAEASRLTFDHIQQRDGRWVLVDIQGKRNRVRSVPFPSWGKAAVDSWAEAAGISSGRVFRPLNRGGRLTGDSMTPQAIRDTVVYHARALGFQNFSAHDARRTWAKLAHKGGADLVQIQLSPGHSSIQTTERYLGVEQDLVSAPCDALGWRLESQQEVTLQGRPRVLR